MSNLKDQFVTYEIALKLKELGFDEDCLGYYNSFNKLEIDRYLHPMLKEYSIPNNNQFINTIIIACPLWQQVIDWFKERHDIHIYTDYYDNLYGFATKLNKEKLYNRYGSFEPGFNTYQEAREQAILKAIEIVKK